MQRLRLLRRCLSDRGTAKGLGKNEERTPQGVLSSLTTILCERNNGLSTRLGTGYGLAPQGRSQWSSRLDLGQILWVGSALALAYGTGVSLLAYGLELVRKFAKNRLRVS